MKVISHPFQILPIQVTGKIKITGIAVDNVFHTNFNSSPLIYNDVVGYLVVSLKITPEDYDWNKENESCFIEIKISEKADNYSNIILKLEKEIQLNKVGETIVFLDTKEVPYGIELSKKKISVTAMHGYRNCNLKRELGYITGFREDRLVTFNNIEAIYPDITTQKIIFKNRNNLTINIEANIFGSKVKNALLCLRLHQNHEIKRRTGYSRRWIEKETNLIFFKRIQLYISNQKTQIPFSISGIQKEIQNWSSAFAYIQIIYNYDEQLINQEYPLGTLEVLEESDFKIDNIDISPFFKENKSSFILESSSSQRRRRTRRRNSSPKPDSKRLSGSHWVAKFPTSKSLNTLKGNFKTNCIEFVKMLKKNGAIIKINATYRPKERAYLMHFSYKISAGLISPSKVPSEKGVNIIWNHGNIIKSRKASSLMVSKYNIAYPPARESKHTLGKAIDMSISSLPNSITFEINGEKISKKIGNKTASENEILWDIAKKYYQVIKLPNDPPHWYGE
jgi:hypothetical protein